MTMVGWKLHMSLAPALVILVDFSTNAEGENNSYDLESKSNDWKVQSKCNFCWKKIIYLVDIVNQLSPRKNVDAMLVNLSWKWKTLTLLCMKIFNFHIEIFLMIYCTVVLIPIKKLLIHVITVELYKTSMWLLR